VGLVMKVKCIRGPKNAGNILFSSGYSQVRLLLTWSLVSLGLQGKSKLAPGHSVPSSETETRKYQMNGNQPSVMMRMLFVSVLNRSRTVETGVQFKIRRADNF